jgi:hypothetical protein
MLKRREFLQSSAAVATIGFFGTPTHARRSPTHIDFVIVDEQLEDSVAFAEELVQRGAKPFELQQDIGRLWFGKLGNAFTRGKTLAGLTVHSDLLVCESFARDSDCRAKNRPSAPHWLQQMSAGRAHSPLDSPSSRSATALCTRIGAARELRARCRIPARCSRG